MIEFIITLQYLYKTVTVGDRRGVKEQRDLEQCAVELNNNAEYFRNAPPSLSDISLTASQQFSCSCSQQEVKSYLD